MITPDQKYSGSQVAEDQGVSRNKGLKPLAGPNDIDHCDRAPESGRDRLPRKISVNRLG